ncbi:MAG: hypothetical protein HOM90_11190 [Porticoccaceae bacterium]|nr:hypothetical protein [Porticoccaceae bacterium]MBT3799266.1 hypothetical protein [Porticoccaceae bacterium]MBT4163610.1 hypothetical protein [Porticoccaceae bacterium]MBT4212075.1 hypothetical protein [Porticoccaceae bacterium]MBT4591976.1 hypothetical protein [Porticoccaceae bacterium]
MLTSYGDELKVRLRAPPIDGQANAQLINYFSLISQRV